ncbi:PilN domain-containing protein [Nitrospira sp. Kam-Ns4a]
MIRINLLPGPRAKAVRAQQDVRIQAASAAGLVVLVLGGCLVYSWALGSERDVLEKEEADKKEQVKVLQRKVKQVQDYERKRQQLEEKNKIIERLEKERGGPVLVLDHVSRSLEPLKLWLVRLSVKGKDVELEGKALTTNDIVEFVNNLRRTDYFSSVRLIESRAGFEGQVGLYQFRVDLTIRG